MAAPNFIKKTDETKPNPLEVALDPTSKAIAEGAGNITLADIEALKDFRISDTDAAKIAKADILEVKDPVDDPDIGHLVFRWLSPKRRARLGGMQYWQWVKGDLAQLVRKKALVMESVGGGASTSVIVQGDLMLAFMPRSIYESQKKAHRDRSRHELDSIMDKASIESATNPEYQRVEREMSMRTTYGNEENE